MVANRLLTDHPDLASQLEGCLSGIEFIHHATRPATGLPMQLGDFRIIREVGRGGMGVVYEAEQISSPWQISCGPRFERDWHVMPELSFEALLSQAKDANATAQGQLLGRFESWLQVLARIQLDSHLRAKFDAADILFAEALGRLPDDYREVLILRHLEDLPQDQIAERMNRSTGAIRMLWIRALAAFRQELHWSDS